MDALYEHIDDRIELLSQQLESIIKLLYAEPKRVQPSRKARGGIARM